MEIQDYAEEYRSKTDDELLRLALTPEQLTREANVVLEEELTRRGINNPQQMKVFREEEEQYKEEQNRNPGDLFVFHLYGIGRKRFGKAQVIYDPGTGVERFKTTVFVVLFWLPLIPTGTFLVERKRALMSPMRFVQRLPLDWPQVARVWVAMIVGVVALIWALRLIRFFLYRV